MNKRKFIFVGLLFLLLLGGAGYKLYGQREAAIISTGTIEVTKADITAKTNGYIAALYLKEGDQIASGQLAATLDREDLAAQLVRDTAALAKAKAQLADLLKGARPEELREAAASVASAASIYEKTNLDYVRYQALYAEGAVAEQQLDNAKSSNEVAQNALTSAKEKQNLLRAGNREDVILAQQLEVTRAEAVLKGTRIAAKDSQIHSPLNGLVLTKNFERGEYVNAGSAILTIADTKDCWVKIYLPSTELGKIRTGQAAQVKIDAYPDRVFAGQIKEISDTAEYTPRQSITKTERANMVFAVKVSVNNDEGILKPGLPADVILK